MTANIVKETWKLKSPFTTARHYFEEIKTLHVSIAEAGHTGVGEAVGVDNLGESIDSIAQQVENLMASKKDISLETLQDLLPPGGARNALDCALWDLKCKKENKSIWELLQIEPSNITTAYTIPLESPSLMASKAAAVSKYPHLKIKLNFDDPIGRIEAIRQARPDATLIIDCNQGWNVDILQRCAPVMAELGVEMIEQPLKVGEDDALLDYRAPIPICADESCNTSADLPYLAQRYQMVNIKLDKTGGLSEAIKLAMEANQMGLDLMVGNMLGSSLGMAPAFVIAQFCKYVDLDGPLLQVDDRENGLIYEGGIIRVPNSRLWG